MKTMHPSPGAVTRTLLFSLLFLPMAAAADTVTNAPADLSDLSLEQLVNIKVVSVSKKETSLESSPAAITVITQDDIRRLGIESIPEALRLVPGMDVAQINSHEWAVSARGFNGQFADKLLVLIDGRAVYTPAFGGVYWDVQDLPMGDIDRIEVIRGPGATMWGANAVNGVVNIITKNAKDTQGVLVTVEGGTWDQPKTTVQYGGQLATNLYYRTYLKYFNRDSFVEKDGDNAPDSWESIRAGARLDWEPQKQNHFTLQGGGYNIKQYENVDSPDYAPPYWQSNTISDYESGGNILGRWTHDISDTSQFSLQAYNDYLSEEEAGAGEIQDTMDVDAQHRFAVGNWNDIVWGLGYRFTYFDFPNNSYVVNNPSVRHDQLFSGFVQDEITIVPNRLHFTAGTKLEHNDYTGFEYEPSGRLAWTPTDNQTVWAAVSRSIRTPAIYNLYGQFNETFAPPFPNPYGMPIIISVLPNGNLTSEHLIAYELGYRVQPLKSLSFDATGFYNTYNNLINYVPKGIVPGLTPAPHIVEQVGTANNGDGFTYGTELSAQWQPFDFWRLTASYSFFEQNLAPAASFAEDAPEQQAQLRAYLDITPKLEFNGMVSYVDQITYVNIATPTTIPSYVRLDLGLVWHPAKSLELGIWGQNLLQSRHTEYLSDTTTLVTQVPRTFLAKITYQF